MFKKLVLTSLGLFVIMASFVGGWIGSYAYTHPPTPTITPTISVVSLSSDKLWSLIQKWRRSEGLQPYIEDQRLCEIATDRADDEDTDHQGLYDKYSNNSYMIQENLAWNMPSEKETLTKWLNSPAHLETLKKPYIYSCLSTHNGYAVQIFSNF